MIWARVQWQVLSEATGQGINGDKLFRKEMILPTNDTSFPSPKGRKNLHTKIFTIVLFVMAKPKRKLRSLSCKLWFNYLLGYRAAVQPPCRGCGHLDQHHRHSRPWSFRAGEVSKTALDLELRAETILFLCLSPCLRVSFSPVQWRK